MEGCWRSASGRGSGRPGRERTIRVLICVLINILIKILTNDDSAIVRKILTTAIVAESDMEVVGMAPDAYGSRDKILALESDVVPLDGMGTRDGRGFGLGFDFA
jgi:hypothetical protein